MSHAPDLFRRLSIIDYLEKKMSNCPTNVTVTRVRILTEEATISLPPQERKLTNQEIVDLTERTIINSGDISWEEIDESEEIEDITIEGDDGIQYSILEDSDD